MDITELDGEYRITTITNDQSPIEKKSDGTTTIENGQTHRIDDAGCIWQSSMDFIDPQTVSFKSIADPTNATADFCLTKPNGELTRDPVTYETTLNVARKGDKIKISGQIEYGGTTTVITMMRL